MRPGIGATDAFSRPMISTTPARRSFRGFKVIVKRPAFGVGLTGLTPTIETTPVTSGSCRIAASASACKRCISVNDTSTPASDTAVIKLVSCSGRKPLGTAM